MMHLRILLVTAALLSGSLTATVDRNTVICVAAFTAIPTALNAINAYLCDHMRVQVSNENPSDTSIVHAFLSSEISSVIAATAIPVAALLTWKFQDKLPATLALASASSAQISAFISNVVAYSKEKNDVPDSESSYLKAALGTAVTGVFFGGVMLYSLLSAGIKTTTSVANQPAV